MLWLLVFLSAASVLAGHSSFAPLCALTNEGDSLPSAAMLTAVGGPDEPQSPTYDRPPPKDQTQGGQSMCPMALADIADNVRDVNRRLKTLLFICLGSVVCYVILLLTWVLSPFFPPPRTPLFRTAVQRDSIASEASAERGAGGGRQSRSYSIVPAPEDGYVDKMTFPARLHLPAFCCLLVVNVLMLITLASRLQPYLWNGISFSLDARDDKLRKDLIRGFRWTHRYCVMETALQLLAEFSGLLWIAMIGFNMTLLLHFRGDEIDLGSIRCLELSYHAVIWSLGLLGAIFVLVHHYGAIRVVAFCGIDSPEWLRLTVYQILPIVVRSLMLISMLIVGHYLISETCRNMREKRRGTTTAMVTAQPDHSSMPAPVEGQGPRDDQGGEEGSAPVTESDSVDVTADWQGRVEEPGRRRRCLGSYRYHPDKYAPIIRCWALLLLFGIGLLSHEIVSLAKYLMMEFGSDETIDVKQLFAVATGYLYLMCFGITTDNFRLWGRILTCRYSKPGGGGDL
ncbi:unnamed protein product [Vitrella brassicaformis CCMP3155]|uniref:Uncharacterized protein n=3 Tax=Vitrella brassicaformis TaxID=1169539 RepID=A0A0G4H2V0_VITBC|nr:unnamed protein product [Vitrella brassicaformis CCMP3155]|eukprot:CEM37998.1 unnamed protein product [Vitrella brassicaformis CCMP3155]